MRQKLLTKEIEAKIPGFYSQEKVKDPIIYAKFFTPWTGWTWYATEYDKETRTFFGYVVGIEKEWGYFSLDELKAVKGPVGLYIERDIHFTPKPFSKIPSTHKEKEGVSHGV